MISSNRFYFSIGQVGLGLGILFILKWTFICKKKVAFICKKKVAFICEHEIGIHSYAIIVFSYKLKFLWSKLYMVVKCQL
jgi:hypothetical protein